jgi:hypothetical protein
MVRVPLSRGALWLQVVDSASAATGCMQHPPTVASDHQTEERQRGAVSDVSPRYSAVPAAQLQFEGSMTSPVPR